MLCQSPPHKKHKMEFQTAKQRKKVGRNSPLDNIWLVRCRSSPHINQYLGRLSNIQYEIISEPYWFKVKTGQLGKSELERHSFVHQQTFTGEREEEFCSKNLVTIKHYAAASYSVTADLKTSLCKKKDKFSFLIFWNATMDVHKQILYLHLENPRELSFTNTYM